MTDTPGHQTLDTTQLPSVAPNVLAAIAAVVRYSLPTEHADYARSEHNKRDNHIYPYLATVEDWLSEIGYAKKDTGHDSDQNTNQDRDVVRAQER